MFNSFNGNIREHLIEEGKLNITYNHGKNMWPKKIY